MVPHPRNKREAWKKELAALPDQIAEHQRQHLITPVSDKEWRENLRWRIRRDQLRILELGKRLAADPPH